MNCGWENPPGKQTCERCSSPLENTNQYSDDASNGYRPPKTDSDLRSTVREATGYSPRREYDNPSPASCQAAGDDEVLVCNKCGYILSPSMNVCPQCGAIQRRQQNPQNEDSHRKERHCPNCGVTITAGARFCSNCGKQIRNSGTVNAWDNPQGGTYCSLRPIPWGRENISYNAISYSGERIVLNRANTDPNNQTITSHEQAVLTREGNDWYIEDLSEQHSTMLRVSHKTKLEAGDIIALGNRLFEFND